MKIISHNLFSRIVLGLEIGPGAAKAVWVRREEGRREIIEAAIERPAPGESDLLPALGRIARRTRHSYPEIITCFSGQEIRESASLLPPMSAGELAAYLRINPAPAGSAGLENPELGFSVSPVRPAGNKRAVIIQAAPGPVFKRLLDQLGRSNLLPSRLIFPGAAYRNLLPPQPGGVLVAAIGRERTIVYLYQDRELAFVRREERLGLGDLFAAMTAEIAVPGGTARLKPERAEETWKTFGVPGPDRLKEEVDGLPLYEIWPLIRTWCDRLAAALRDGILFHQRQFEPGRVEAVFLTGEGGSVPGLAAYLEENCGQAVAPLPLGEECRWADEPPRNKWEPEITRIQGALGAALASGKETDLLPARDRITRRLLLPLRILWFALPAAALFLLALGRVAGREAELAETRARSLAAAASDLREIRDQGLRRADRVRELSRREIFYRRILEYPDLWIGVLREVARLLPPSLVLDRMELARRDSESVLTLSGHFPGGPDPRSGEDPGRTLTAFARELGASPFFQEPRNLAAGKDELGVYRFSFFTALRREDGP